MDEHRILIACVYVYVPLSDIFCIKIEWDDFPRCGRGTRAAALSVFLGFNPRMAAAPVGSCLHCLLVKVKDPSSFGIQSAVSNTLERAGNSKHNEVLLSPSQLEQYQS